MRSLTYNEMIEISGGFNCLDQQTWKKVQQKAVKDGVVFTILTAPLAGALAYSISGNVLAGIGVGLYVAPFAAMAGLYCSSAWDIFQ